jgi:hypothetical protein
MAQLTPFVLTERIEEIAVGDRRNGLGRGQGLLERDRVRDGNLDVIDQAFLDQARKIAEQRWLKFNPQGRKHAGPRLLCQIKIVKLIPGRIIGGREEEPPW